MRPQSQLRYSLEAITARGKRQNRPVGHRDDQINRVIPRKLHQRFDKTRGIIGRDGVPEPGSTVPGDLRRRMDPSVGTHSYPMPRPTKRSGESECGCTVTIQHQYSCQSLPPKLPLPTMRRKGVLLSSIGVRPALAFTGLVDQCVRPLNSLSFIFVFLSLQVFVAWSGKSRILIDTSIGVCWR